MSTFQLFRNPDKFFQNINNLERKKEVTILMILEGIMYAFGKAQADFYGDNWELSRIIMFCLIFGVLFGWLFVYVIASMTRWSGEYFGGSASNRQILAVAAYSSIPILFAIIPLSLQIILYGRNAFRKFSLLEGSDYYIMSTLGAVQLLLGIVSLGLFVKGVSVVQRFSTWKAMASIVLVPVITFAVVASVLLISNAF